MFGIERDEMRWDRVWRGKSLGRGMASWIVKEREVRGVTGRFHVGGGRDGVVNEMLGCFLVGRVDA